MKTKNQKQQKLINLDKLQLVLLSVGVLIIMLLAISSRNETEINRYPFKTWQIGDIVDDEQLAFTVNNLSEDTHGIPGFWAPKDGEKFMIVDMSYKNKSSEVYHMSPVNYMKLIDSENHEYRVTSAPFLTKGFGGPIKPDTTMSGQVGFIVSKSAEGLKLVFDPHIVDENIINVYLPPPTAASATSAPDDPGYR